MIQPRSKKTSVYHYCNHSKQPLLCLKKYNIYIYNHLYFFCINVANPSFFTIPKFEVYFWVYPKAALSMMQGAAAWLGRWNRWNRGLHSDELLGGADGTTWMRGLMTCNEKNDRWVVWNQQQIGIFHGI